jgi:hypothetical protein
VENAVFFMDVFAKDYVPWNNNAFFFNLQKKSKDHFGIEGDEGSTMVEDSVSPLK